MKTFFRAIYYKQAFYPDYLIGIWINPFFIIRRGLIRGVRLIASKFVGGKLLDVGCGSKPYEPLFSVDDYVGIDIEVSGHDHASSKANKFYDGKTIPFSDGEFDWVFSSEVFEHVFNLDELLGEINRVLHKDGRLAFTCPFVWDEHEQPFDFARYTSFAIRDMMEKNGFEVEVLIKSTNHFETIMQMLSAYISQHCLPRNVYLRFLMYPIFGAPFNIVGCLLGKLLPKSENLYLNNVVIARKR